MGWVAALALAMLIGSASQPSGLGWASLSGGPAIARAQGAGSTDYLIRLLADSDAFRVRVRAADALGSRGTDAGVIPALTTALRDDNAAVRAAAVASLGRVGDASVLAAVRALLRDPEAAVVTAARAAIAAIEARTSGGGGGGGGTTPPPSGTPTFYVGIGMPAGSASAAVRSSARESLRRTVGAMTGVVIAPDGESAADATRELRRRSLTGFFLDTSITVEDTPAGVRVAVQIIVQDYPGRNMRAMLRGSATITEVHDLSSPAVSEALGPALTSALRGLPAAMAGSRGGGSR